MPFEGVPPACCFDALHSPSAVSAAVLGRYGLCLRQLNMLRPTNVFVIVPQHDNSSPGYKRGYSTVDLCNAKLSSISLVIAFLYCDAGQP